MAYTVTVSNAQMKKAYSAFCNGWIDALTSETGPLESRHADLLRESLAERLQEVGKKMPQKAAGKSPKKKSPKKAKKATPKGPSKRELKVKELQNELKTTYGIESTTATVSELRKEIAAAKKAQKAAAKEAKKATASEKKAATPSKRDQKKIELYKELTALGHTLPGCENETDCLKFSIADIRAAIKAATPKKKKGRKAGAKKSPAKVQKAQKDLIAELVGAPAAAAAEKPKPKPKVTYELAGGCTIGAVTMFTGGANGEVVATKFHQKEPEQKTQPVAQAKATSEIEFEDELEVDELSEIDSSDDEEIEVEFPGMDEVDEFSHDSRPGETLYKDANNCVWNDEQDLVGVFHEEEDVIVDAE